MHLEKVTACVLRIGESGQELLVFKHPTAGFQLPAGTVEKGETPEFAVVREVWEETGLSARVVRKLGVEERNAPAGRGFLRSDSLPVRSAPREEAVVPGAVLPRGQYQLGELRDGFVFVRYQEYDLNRQPPFLLWAVESWVPESEIAPGTRRHFFQVEALNDSPSTWDHPADMGHTFHLFWAAVDHLPELIGEQNDWLKRLAERLAGRKKIDL